MYAPGCNWQDFFLFMAEYHSIVHYYHILFIHSFVNGHLGCFYFMAIACNTVMNIDVHVSFQISVLIFFLIYTQEGSYCSHGSSIFTFWCIFVLSSTVAAPICKHLNSAPEFPFLGKVVNICYLCTF